MTVQAPPARGMVQPARLVAGTVALTAVFAVNAVDLAGGAYRWWANFILLPGAALVLSALALPAGTPPRAVARYALACVGGLVFAVGAILMTAGMGRLWPLMIVLPCLAVAGTARWRPADPIAAAMHRTVTDLAALGIVLGSALLVLRLTAVDLPDRWWCAFIVAAGLIAAGRGLWLLRHRGGYAVPATVLLAGLGLAAILTGLRLLALR